MKRVRFFQKTNLTKFLVRQNKKRNLEIILYGNILFVHDYKIKTTTDIFSAKNRYL